MKKTLIIIMALALAALLAGPALAITTAPQSASAASAAYAGDTVPKAWVATNYDSNAQVVLKYLNATSDQAGSYLNLYWHSETSGGRTTVDAAGSGVTLPLTSTTGFSVYSLIVIQNSSGKVIEREVAAVDAGVSVTLDAALASGFGSVGDQVVKMADNWEDFDARIPVGAATITPSNADGLFFGPRNSPIMMGLEATTASRIDTVTWDLE